MVSIPFLKMLDRLIREAVSLEVFILFITNTDLDRNGVVKRSHENILG